jgi:hypothetical protein
MIIAAIAIPHLTDSKISRSEASAVASMHSISSRSVLSIPPTTATPMLRAVCRVEVGLWLRRN